jgi:diguanylate cyclase (GGDEF)-like protein
MSAATSPLTASGSPPLPAPWDSVLDHLIEAACLVDADTLRILHANPAAAALWARSCDSLGVDTVLSLACTPEDLCHWSQATHDTRLPALHTDTLICRADGSTLAVERRISPIMITPQWRGWLLSWVDSSARHTLEAELARLAGELGAALDTSRDAILITDLSGEVRTYNPAFAQMWSLPGAPRRQCDSARVHDAIRRHTLAPDRYGSELIQRLQELRTQAHGCVSDQIVLTDGRTLERRLLPQYGRGEVVGWVQIWSDLTAQLADQARLQLAAQVFDSTLDAILVTSANGQILAANPAAERLSGRSALALQSMSMHELLCTEPDDAPARPHGRPPWAGLGDNAHRWEGSLWLRSAAGLVPLQASLVEHRAAPATQDGEATGTGCIAVLRDMSERQAWRRQLQELNQTDTLTALPNRERLLSLLHAALTPAASTSGQAPRLALLQFGLDRFKHINDTFGHLHGDRVLIETSRRLSLGLRAGDTVARLDGDQFVVLLPGADAQVAELIGRRLLAQLAEDWVLNDQAVSIGASVGIALSPGDARDADELMSHADHAMQRVKQRRGGDVRFYQPQMNIDRLARLKLDHAMRRALPQGRFSLHYQPQLDLASGRVIGAEALCRWHDTELGPVSPARFIPVAEETGFIAELGDWVLREAVGQAAQWRARGIELPVSVNVSLLQFQQPQFVKRVVQTLASAQLPARLLELELTESILADDLAQVLAQLHQLAQAGVQLAIDDFGTGYASLSYLKQLPIHRLKIDRSFIQRLPADASDAAITRTIVDLARALKLQVIAEGVETAEQHDYLASIGCHEFQGFLFSPAVPAAQFEALLLDTQRRSA